MKMVIRTLVFVAFVFLVWSKPVLSHSTHGAEGCSCEEHDLESDPKSVTLPYKVGSIFAILLASGVGVAVPLAGKRVPALSPDGDVFFMIKAFAAGIILSTGFIHILPGAYVSLTSPCLTNPIWEKFPFTGFIAMIAAIATLMIESTATGYYRRRHSNHGGEEVATEPPAGHVHVHAHGHAHEDEASSKFDIIRHRVTTQVLELGIVVHSVIIGISMGTSQSLATIKTLLVALCFHQFFEGLGLGGCIAQAKFKLQTIVTMAMFFSLTTPLGVAIGIGIGNSYNENSPTALIVQGVLDSAAGGILIYMALVGLLASDFMSPRMQKSPRLQLGANASLLLGAACMSILAKWA